MRHGPRFRKRRSDSSGLGRPDLGSETRGGFGLLNGRVRISVLAAILSAIVLFPGCFTWPKGISPVAPKHRHTVHADTPTLNWKAVSPGNAEEVRYQVAIYGSNDQLVYEANNLSGTSHRVNTRLASGRYKWTLRPFYLRNGRWEEGNWNRRKYFWFAVVVFGWGETLYEFDVTSAVDSQIDEPVRTGHSASTESQSNQNLERSIESSESPGPPEVNDLARSPVIGSINAQISAIQFFLDDQIDSGRIQSFVNRCESAKFRSQFDQESTRYVWFCVFFTPHGKFKAGTTEVSMALRRAEDESLVLWFPVSTVEVKPEFPFFMLLQGYGAKETGKIPSGKYVVEVYSSSEKVGAGGFEIK